MAKKRYPLGTFMKELARKENAGSIWQNCSRRKVLSATNAAAVTHMCCPTAGINAPDVTARRL